MEFTTTAVIARGPHGVDEGEIYYVIEYSDGEKEDMNDREYNYARFLAACDESHSSDDSDDGYEITENAGRGKSESSTIEDARYPIGERKLHVLSWTNSAPQDGKGTLDCHFSYPKKDLVQRLDEYQNRFAKANAVGESFIIAGPNDGASDPLPETSVQNRNETDELADITNQRILNDAEVEEKPDLDPDDFDGVDQEDLLS